MGPSRMEVEKLDVVENDAHYVMQMVLKLYRKGLNKYEVSDTSTQTSMG